VDLQALTVGVAVVSMGAWLAGARAALLQDAAAPLDASRKLAVVNGLGEHSRAQARPRIFSLMSGQLRLLPQGRTSSPLHDRPIAPRWRLQWTWPACGARPRPGRHTRAAHCWAAVPSGAPRAAQGHSAAVKEAVGASLLGCKAPFRLVQDHSRSGRLEASTLALRKWLFSDAFERYLALVQPGGAGPQARARARPACLRRG